MGENNTPAPQPGSQRPAEVAAQDGPIDAPRQFEPVYESLASAGSALVGMLTEVEVSGIENIPETGCVVASNHYSEFDALLVMKALVDEQVPVRVLAKAPLFKVPLLGWAMRKTGQVPVHRGSGQARDALGHAKAALAKGEVVMIYPEGTLTRQPDYWPMRPKNGVGRLALAGHPVVPCANWGALEVMGRYRRRLRIGGGKKASVKFGEPIDFSDLIQELAEGGDEKELANRAADRVIDRITALLEELRGEKAPAVRYDMKVHGDPGTAALRKFEAERVARERAAKRASKTKN